MTPFALIANWSDRPVSSIDVETLLDAIPSRCADGRRSVAVPGAAVVVGLRVVSSGEGFASGLVVEREEQWLAVGDVRLYDRSSLVGSLGADAANQPDIVLLSRAYRRFGESGVVKIAGDFALVIWDWKERHLHAIRDQFGVRPLFYRLTKEGMALATDVRSLLALEPDDRELDPGKVVDYLLTRSTHLGHTFYANVNAVRPAHRLFARSRAVLQARYWTPSFQPFLGTYPDVLHEWRRNFRIAVRDRLQSQRPIAAYLSGGLDSSSIVGATQETLGNEVSADRRPLALSARFSGLPCDEKPYIDAVLRGCPGFDSFTWDGREPNHEDLENPSLVAPGLGQGIGRSPRKEFFTMRERDMRVVLSGEGGDALSLCAGAIGDLAFRGSFAKVLRELAAFGSWRRARVILQVERNVAYPRGPESPSFSCLTVEAQRELMEKATPATTSPRPSLVQWNTWREVDSAPSYACTDMVVQSAADSGIEIRMPYLDLRLVEFVLGIPCHHRLPNGDLRRLQREGAAPFLPDIIVRRRNKAGFSATLADQVRANSSRIDAILRRSTWVSSRFVEQQLALRNWEEMLRNDPGIARPNRWLYLWKIAMFEAWLQRVLGYDTQPKRAT